MTKSIFFTAMLTVLLVMQITAQPIHDRTEKSDLVVEGRVIRTESFWHRNQTQIFTSNLIEISRVFKGQVENGFVEVVTRGGMIDDRAIIAVHSPFYAESQEGIFFCKSNRHTPTLEGKGNIAFVPSSGENSFIEYHSGRVIQPATDKSAVYSSIEKEVYPAITGTTGIPPSKIGDNIFEREFAEWLLKHSVNISAESGNETIMEFTFQNITLTDDLSAVSFDVYSKGNTPVRFCEADVVIEYTTDAFGSYVVGNDNITVTKGDIIQSSNYSVATSDSGEKKMKAELTGSYSDPSELYLLTTTSEKLLHIELGIVDFSALGTVNFDDFAMAGEALFHDSETDACLPFDKMIIEGTVQTSAIPIIEGFDPPSLNAGISNVLTIWGANFDTIKGKVWFQNADVDLDIFPGTYMHTQESDILEWTNDTIRVEVPSVELAARKPAGTGFIRVENASGVSPLLFDQAVLNVGYSVINFRVGIEGNAVRLHLVEDGTPNPAYRFYVDSTLAAKGAGSCVNDAICEWNQKTEVDWEFKGTSPASEFAYDTYNLVFWDSSLIGSDNHAVTYIAPGYASIGICDTFLMVFEEDIGINPERNWSFACGESPDSTEYDFFSTILHELGHAHLLDHALPKGKEMYPHTGAGELKNTITATDEAGGDNVMANNAIPAGCNALPIQPTSIPGCVNSAHEEFRRPIKVFPNPVGEELNIEMYLQESSTVAILLHDYLGRILLNKEYQLHSGNQEVNLKIGNLNIPNGIYFVHVLVNDDYGMTEKILKLKQL